jgi:hypothetical protein
MEAGEGAPAELPARLAGEAAGSSAPGEHAAAGQPASPGADAAGAALRAALREVAADAEGRLELAAFAAAVRGAGNVKEKVLEEVLKWKAPERAMISVILSVEEPLRLDSRDTVARRLGGEAVSHAVFKLVRTALFKRVAQLAWIVSAATLPMCFFGILSPVVSIFLNLPHYLIAPVFGSAVYLYPVVQLLLKRFDVWFVAANMAVMVSSALRMRLPRARRPI